MKKEYSYQGRSTLITEVHTVQIKDEQTGFMWILFVEYVNGKYSKITSSSYCNTEWALLSPVERNDLMTLAHDVVDVNRQLDLS
jgi:hypothetical protein